MAIGALETLKDPLLEPVLALMKDAVNAELGALAAAADPPGDGSPFVKTTAARPFVLSEAGDNVLPALYAYRVRSRTRQTTFGHRDQLATVQFHYVSPAVSQELIDDRWPALDRVWRVALRALSKGHHPSHENDDPVLDAVQVTKVDLTTALKREAFTEGGDYTYPSFLAEIDITWRDPADEDPGTLYPALSFDTRIYTNTSGDTTGEPDVIGRAVTADGIAAVPPDGRNFPTPDDWSL